MSSPHNLLYSQKSRIQGFWYLIFFWHSSCSLVGFFSRVHPASNYYSQISLLNLSSSLHHLWPVFLQWPPASLLSMPPHVLPSLSPSFRVVILNYMSDYGTSLLELSSDFPLKMFNSWLWPTKPYEIQILLTSQTSAHISQVNHWDTAIRAFLLPRERVWLVPFSESLPLLFLLFGTIFPIPLFRPSPPTPSRFLMVAYFL